MAEGKFVETRDQALAEIVSSHGAKYRLAHSREAIGSSESSYGIRIYVAFPPHVTAEQREKLNLYSEEDVIQRKVEELIERAKPGFDQQVADHIATLRELFTKAGFPAVYVRALPNQYSTSAWTINAPWIVATTSIGHIKIGWRKRVINIDWTDTDQKASGLKLFPTEDTTRSGQYSNEESRYVHAWSLDKAVEYLRIIHTYKPESSE